MSTPCRGRSHWHEYAGGGDVFAMHDFPNPHLLPQNPQFGSALRTASHPLPGRPSQSPNPGLHTKPHVGVVPEQVAVAFTSAGHAVAHAPQWFGSVDKSAQKSGVPVHLDVGGEQTSVHDDETHVVPPVHVVPHVPQLLGSVRVSAQ